jgi:hypothetical protein
MTQRLAVVPISLSLLLACARETSQATEVPASDPAGKVRWFGALHEIVVEQRTEARVRVADASRRPHTFGVGALSELRGELTILDDVAWIARGRGDGTASVNSYPLRDTQEGAALLVVANVGSWRDVPVTENVPSDQLDAFLARQIEYTGIPPNQPVPVMVRGPLADVRWHVVDGIKAGRGADHASHLKGAVTGHIPAASEGTTLIGFFSRDHAGVFTHHGSFSHFHVVCPSPMVAAHVDAVTLRKGAVLRVPTP